MAVSIRVAHMTLVLVNDITKEVVQKNAPGTTNMDMLRSSSQFRVKSNGTGFVESPNAVDFPTIEEYLSLEAADNHALAYVGQDRIITQEIT